VPALADVDTISTKLLKTETASSDIPSAPLGLGPTNANASTATPQPIDNQTTTRSQLPSPYKATSLPLADRLAARDRAYALLTGLTRLGDGWNRADAWFALARAYEESGQPDKAKEVLWWCVELEEATGVREWRCVGGSGGYTL
jgi:Tfp pilus assembly protein FimV